MNNGNCETCKYNNTLPPSCDNCTKGYYRLFNKNCTLCPVEGTTTCYDTDINIAEGYWINEKDRTDLYLGDL